MAGNEDVTLGEVYRLILGVQRDIREQNTKFIPVTLYTSERDSMKDDMKDMGSEIAELRSNLKIEHDARIEAEQERDKEASTRRLQWTLTILSPFIGVIVTWLAVSTGLLHATP